jgi:hypothetical protein
MRPVGVLHGEIVQVELLLDLAQQLLAGLVEPDPDEVVVLAGRAAGIFERDLDAPAGAIGGAVDQPLLGEGLGNAARRRRRPRLELRVRRFPPPAAPSRAIGTGRLPGYSFPVAR